MGGIVDCEVDLDTKSSPVRAAIEKAQAELLQEYDVRETRRRELEFLENGGNPLDFKTGHAASISVQSTSLTDHLAEQYVISEAKGSFALAASPNGYSVESSGRPGGSSGREPNIGDNLLLFDGENSNIYGERNVKHRGKRGSAAPLEQSSQIDACHNVQETEDSVIFCRGFKSRAYARRNRSRSNRDNARVVSTDLFLSHSSRSSVLPSSRPDSRDAEGSLWETQPVHHAGSSIPNSKPASTNANIVSKASTSDGQLDMELDAVQTRHTHLDVIKGGVAERETEVKASDNLQENNHNIQHSHVAPEKVTNDTTSQSSDSIGKNVISVGLCSAPFGSTENTKEIIGAERVNGFSVKDENVTDSNDDPNRKSCLVDLVTKVLNIKTTKTDTSHVHMSSRIDQSAGGDLCSMLRRADGGPDADFKEHSAFREILSTEENNGLGEKDRLAAVDAHIDANHEPKSAHLNLINTSIQIKGEVELCNNGTDLQSEVKPLNNIEDMKLNGEAISKSERIKDKIFGDNSRFINKAGIMTSGVVVPTCEPAHTTFSKRDSTTTELQNCAPNHLKLTKKAHEDAVLKEARKIEANLRRTGELSKCTIYSEKRKKCHWDFVLEEMAWMSNDFMQERVWKTTAAAQICHSIASSGRLKFEHENMLRKQRSVARTLAKAIMHFWHSVEALRTGGEAPIGTHSSDLFKSWKVNRADAVNYQGCNYDEAENSIKILRPALEGYAVRFLDYASSTSRHPILAEAPSTPDRINDTGILLSWEDQPSEEILFYTVPPGAMQAYRESVESQWIHSKKAGNTLHEEDCETSMCDSVADGPQENDNEENEGETGTYILPGAIEGSSSLKFAHRKRKNLQQKSYAARLYELGSDLSYENRVGCKSTNQPLMFSGKRPSSTLDVGSVPTKRVRTATRQRVVSPFSAGMSGILQVSSSRTDFSSGDTNSFQDDDSLPHGGSQPRKNLEVESTTEFKRQFPFDGYEISSKSKKKKKPKHLGYKNSLNITDSGVLGVSGKGSLYEQRLQVDSRIQHEQMNHVKKRSESQQFDSNGNSGHYGQHAAKKPKLLKHLPEVSPEVFTLFSGSAPSPIDSQMSNMSSPKKLIKIICNRDRGRKSKAMKMRAGQSGSGIPWSNFEDQALVVLVHDMGTNWELVSDAINCTLQFKCVFRNPSECKERHKFLMDRSTGDGADSADDSGSSQPYPSTLRGIPKGSARQLFQRLQGPMEEDTLKAHFVKIILISQNLHACRTRNGSQELKQVTKDHSSHVAALSQVCPNNLTGGVLTPLDLCDAITSSSDVHTIGYQGSHTGGLSIPGHQGSVAPFLPTSCATTMLQGSPSMVLGNNLPSPSTPMYGPARDAQRCGMPRSTSLPADDQHRMQQYNQMFYGRNIPQSTMPIPGAIPAGVDRGVRMLQGGNGMGMMCGNRGMPMPRPGFQGISPPSMINMVSTGSVLSGTSIGMPNPVNVHPTAMSGPGNSMMRPHDALPMLPHGQNTEDHRQMVMQELQLQVSQGNCQPVASFSCTSVPFSNVTVPPPVQTFPVQQNQQFHQMPQQPQMLGSPHHPHIQASNHSRPQQQAYAVRLAKERQLQQRIMSQQQHPFSGSNAMQPVQNISQVQQQARSPSPGKPNLSSQAHHRQQVPQNSQPGNGMPNPMMKQRQRQQVQHQQPRPQQQQKQQSQQQAKLTKGFGRGTMLMHQNLSIDGSHVSGISTAPMNQVSEKHLTQGQCCQPSNQPKLYSRPPMPSNSDNPYQDSIQVPPSRTLLAPQQSPVPSLHLATQQQQRQTNQSEQNMQRSSLEQSCQVKSDGRIQPSIDQVRVNQMIWTTSIPQCTESSTPVVSSAIQCKHEPSYDTTTPTTSHLASSPQENLVGNEALIPPSSQGLAHRHFSGSGPLHKHGIGGQWKQQQ